MCKCQKTNARVFLEEFLCEHFPNDKPKIKPVCLNEFETSYNSFFFQQSGELGTNYGLTFMSDFTGKTYSGYLVNFDRNLTDSEISLLAIWQLPE